jgi:hypothetical protein
LIPALDGKQSQQHPSKSVLFCRFKKIPLSEVINVNAIRAPQHFNDFRFAVLDNIVHLKILRSNDKMKNIVAR